MQRSNKEILMEKGSSASFNELKISKKLSKKLNNGGYHTLGDVISEYDTDLVIYTCNLNRRQVAELDALIRLYNTVDNLAS